MPNAVDAMIWQIDFLKRVVFCYELHFITSKTFVDAKIQMASVFIQFRA